MARQHLIEYFRWNRERSITVDRVSTFLGVNKQVIINEINRWRREGKLKRIGGKGLGRGKGRSKRKYVLTKVGLSYLELKGIAI